MIRRVGLRRNGPPPRRAPLRAESAQRRRDRRVRRERMLEFFGTDPRCAFPGCGAPATDAHEIKSRARGGSILEPANVAPLCRQHHRYVTEHPAEAERLGLSLPSWGGDAA